MSRSGGGDRAAHRAERRVGVGAERSNGADADHDNEGQHDRVLDGAGTIFMLEKLNEESTETSHEYLLRWGEKRNVRVENDAAFLE